MKIFRFDPATGKSVTQYNSVNVNIARILRAEASFQVDCMYVEANGVVGYHQAVEDQLFLVVQGEGWVRGESPERRPIHSGQAAFWQRGEWHESGTEMGMVAIIIEGMGLKPASYMEEA